MQITIPIPQNPKWVFLIFFFLFHASFSDPQTSEAGLFCGSLKLESSPNFIPNFISAMEEVSKRVKEFHWGSNSIVFSKPHVFTYAQCYGFLSHEDCLACYHETWTKLPKCLPNNSARIYLDGCFLRYDTYSFFTEALNEKHDTVKCGLPMDVSKDKYIEVEFGKRIDQVVRNVIDTAVANEGYALKGGRGGVEAVYAMAQCWKTMDSKRCKECLFDAGSKLRQCAPATDGRAMNAGCYLRYSTEKFFSNGPVGESKFGKNKLLS